MAKGKLIVLSAPSGCGKTTIAKAVLNRHPRILFSVSATTRPRRNAEMEGKDYFFLPRTEFENRIRKGDLIEWEEIYGNYYGTLKSEVNKALQQGRAMLFDVDVKGGLSIRKAFRDDSVLIFIKPPSFEVLWKRLENRKTENFETFKVRMERVPMELEEGNKFDFQVVNDDLQKAIEEVDRIVRQHAMNLLV
jgi:guanylate kinase